MIRSEVVLPSNSFVKCASPCFLNRIVSISLLYLTRLTGYHQRHDLISEASQSDTEYDKSVHLVKGLEQLVKTGLDTTAFPLKCPKCGQLKESEVEMYDRDLRRRNFVILPVHPRCRSCSTELECIPGDRGNRNSFAVILTGTCGSGKSAVSEFLMCHHDFTVIDGDCVMSVVEHRRGDQDFQPGRNGLRCQELAG